MMPEPTAPFPDDLELTAPAEDFLEADGPDLLARWGRHLEFWDARLAADLDPFWRTQIERIGPECTILTRAMERISGINVASQDYLSLAGHPAVCGAAIEAVGRWGVHSAGPGAQQGTTAPVATLEERMAEFLSCREATVFPTGWAAGFGAIRALVREGDHVVIDSLAHACLLQGAASATRHVHRVAHASNEAIATRLARIRTRNAGCGILVVTEAVFALDSATPELARLQSICNDYHATLLLAVAHDLGALGDGGFGRLGEQGMLGAVDIVVGSFSKVFASNGGFVASSAPGIRQALRGFSGPLGFSSALSPVQGAVINAALDVVRSREGAQRRRRLLANAQRLRAGLQARAFRVLGQSSGIVPVALGSVVQARLMTRAALHGGALVNLVEHPAISRLNARWCLHVMADHTEAQIDRLIAIAVAAREQARPPDAPADPNVVPFRPHPPRTGEAT